jgi:carboxylesterase type B
MWPSIAKVTLIFSLLNITTISTNIAKKIDTNPIVHLSYGSFQGAYSSTYNITYFRKIPFAEPPIGINRFRAPQPVKPITNGIYNSSETFDMCPQRTVNGSEDCLYLGLYARPWSIGEKLRPVVINFYGGAFIEGGGSFNVPPSAWPILNVSTENDYIMVEPNYRVNAFGFLPGKEILKDPYSDLNVGLLDQHAVLKWVNKNIYSFGGDRKNVTIWGQSAGAGSVVAQSIANPKLQQGLITRALMSSPFWPKTYRYDSLEAEQIYQNFAELANCSGLNSLQCLKATDLQTLRTAALMISNSHTYNTSSYTWAPVIGDDFLPLPLSQANEFISKNLQSAWGMYNLHEGENFIPPGLANNNTSFSAPDGSGTSFNSTQASFLKWLSGFLPSITLEQREEVENKYPSRGSTENLLLYNTTFIQAGLIYRDIVLACPAYWLASSTGNGYVGEYTILPAKHGSDTEWWNQVNVIQEMNPLIYQGFAGAFASYFDTGDPNFHKLTNKTQPEVPRLVGGFEKEFVIQDDGFITTTIDQLKDRCQFWKSIAYNIPI